MNENNLKLLKKYKMICTNKGLTEETIKAFECDLRLFFRYIGDKSIEEISHHEIEEFLYYCQIERNNSSAAINRKFTSLNSFYKSLIKKDYLNVVNPMDKLDKPKTRKKVKDYLTEEELNKILDHLKEKNDLRGLAFFYLAYSSACRITELYQLNRDSLDMNKREFKVLGKGQKERMCIFSETAKEYVQQYLNNRKDNLEALFVSRENNRWSRRAIQCFVKNIVKAVDINKHITPHSLRHSILTNLRLKGISLDDLCLLAGHSQISTTQSVYAHVGLEDIRSKFDKLNI